MNIQIRLADHLTTSLTLHTSLPKPVTGLLVCVYSTVFDLCFTKSLIITIFKG